MIETSSLGNAVGIQRGDVIDRTEGTQLPRLGTGVIIGKFKRGRVGKVFVVNRDNYQAILGHDPLNPSYQAVEDALARGAANVKVLRTGESGVGGDMGSGAPSIDFSTLPLVSGSLEFSDYTAGLDPETSSLNFAVQINGTLYNADKSQGLMEITDPAVTSVINFYYGSGSSWYVHVLASGIQDIVLIPSEQQRAYSNWFMVDGYRMDTVGLVPERGYIDEQDNIYMRFERLA